jgi:riboflavin synthase
MFSGIIECTSSTVEVLPESTQDLIRFLVSRPQSFNDVKVGDSIALNGVCLTLEKFDDKTLQFALGKETLQITGWTKAFVEKALWNMERSLRLQDRIHGHLVTGHVDFRGEVAAIRTEKELSEIWVRFPAAYREYFWKKGSVTLNGVSLTLNEVKNDHFRVNLIPETLRVTNLGDLKPQQALNVEVDSFARGMIHYFKERQP